MGGGLSSGERELLARSGVRPIGVGLGLALFDAAVGLPDALVVPLGLDAAALGRGGEVPAVYRGLVRGRSRRVAGSGESGVLVGRLAGLGERDRVEVVVELVRAKVAAVLGHVSGEVIEPERAFSELGFDSLAALELRNELAAATGLRLPATLTFDYPNTQTLAELLVSQLTPSVAAGGDGSEEDEIRRALASIPFERLRAAGLMDGLLELAGIRQAQDHLDDEQEESIDDLDADALINMALADRDD